MIKKKICLLGSFRVGKSSLIRKYVLNIFSDEYLSTIGVKVDKKVMKTESGEELMLVIWDLEGRDDFEKVSDTYLRGMSGYFLVADGTRKDTLESILKTRKTIQKLFPDVPCVVLLNKSDLKNDWVLKEADYQDFKNDGIPVLETSALSGTGVEEAFQALAKKMME